MRLFLPFSLYLRMVSFSRFIDIHALCNVYVSGVPSSTFEVAWYVVRRFGRVLSCLISVPTDCVTVALFCVDVDYDVLDNVEVGAICRLWCML